MRAGDRPTTIIVIAFTLALAGLVGLAIPFGSGARLGGTALPWISPTPTATTTPPDVAMALESPSPSPTLFAAPVSSPTGEPPQPTETRLLQASPSRAASAARETTPTETPAPASAHEASPTATAALPAALPETVSRAEIAVEQVNLRSGPGQGFAVVGLARTGDTFTVTARSLDGDWLRICCVSQAPVWLAAGLVTVTGTIEGLPIAP